MATNDQFYNELSDDYDVMIHFENALKNKISYLKNFHTTVDRTALDLGCGTAADAIALFKLGLQVDAVDHSKGMLQQAIKNAEKFSCDINFIESGLTTYAIKNKKYDFIVSLGNTIANINKHELRVLLSKIFDSVDKCGRVLIQIINYAKLPEIGTHILNVFENDEVSITRKYNIKRDHIDFIIDKIDKNNKHESQIITKLFPHSENDFREMAKTIGFNVNFYGNLKKDEYRVGDSPNLVVLLEKIV